MGDIPTGKGTQAVDLAFTHDINGLLEVEATVVSTEAQVAVVFEQRAGRLGAAEREAAIAALARLKVVPADLLPNRLLLEEALTRHQRLDAEGKRLLDGPLLAFEDALARQQPEAVAAAGEALRRALAHPLLN